MLTQATCLTPHGPFVLHREDHTKSEVNLKKSVSRNINGKFVEKNSQIEMLGKNIHNLREHGAPQTCRGKIVLESQMSKRWQRNHKSGQYERTHEHRTPQTPRSNT